MNKQDMMKVQTCILRVNIHCDGCKAKVKKIIQKVPGVYKVAIEADQGKVTVSGNVDPQLLINKLEKSGKHAELWGGKNGQAAMNNLFSNFNFGKLNNGGKDSNGSQKGGKNQEKLGHQQKKEMKFVGKNQKSGNLSFSEDEFDDEFDEEESDDEIIVPQPLKKAAKAGGNGQALKAKTTQNDRDSKGHNKGENGKKGGKIDAFLKGVMGKAAGKKGKDGNKNGGKGESGIQTNGVGKKGVKNVDFVVIEGKNGAKKEKDGKNNGKKGGEKLDGGLKMENKLQGINEMNPNHMGGKNIGGTGNYHHPMGQMSGFPVDNFPAASGMNTGHGNPYNNPQFMAQMMMNQQRGNGHDMYNHSMMYGRPPPAMNHHGQPPVNDQFTHYFSDENTDSCSIM